MDKYILKALQDIASELKKIRKIMERQENAEDVKLPQMGYMKDAEEDDDE